MGMGQRAHSADSAAFAGGLAASRAIAICAACKLAVLGPEGEWTVPELDYTIVWRSGYPGLMLKHALFLAPEGLLSKFNDLETVDYGTNVPDGEYISHFSQIDKTDGYPSCDPNQFMAWFRLPSVKSLGLWNQSLQEVVPTPQPLHLDRLHILVLTRSTIKEEEIPGLLSETPNLRTLHLGLAYLWGKSCPLRNGAAVLQRLHSVSRTIEVLSFLF